MKKLVFLGAGNIASETAKLVRDEFSDVEMVIADINKERADEVATEVNGTSAYFDATSPESIAEVTKEADLVFNAVGPFYRYGLGIIKEVINNKVNYIDICDEFDVTVSLVEDAELDQQAKDAGIFAMYGMGFSPGASNLAAKWASDLLDQTKTIEIATVIPYFPNLGTTVNDHMLFSMSGNVPQFVNGKIEYLPAWGGEKRFEFKGYGPMDVGYMGHPEGVSLGHSIPGIENASIRFRWYEDEGTEIWKTFERLGLTEDVEEENLPMSPRQFLARYMDSPSGMKHLSLSEESNARQSVFQVNAYGKRDGKEAKTTIEYQTGNYAGDPTPICAAGAIAQALNGQIKATGLIAPETGIADPDKFVKHVIKTIKGELYLSEEIEETVINMED